MVKIVCLHVYKLIHNRIKTFCGFNNTITYEDLHRVLAIYYHIPRRDRHIVIQELITIGFLDRNGTRGFFIVEKN